CKHDAKKRPQLPFVLTAKDTLANDLKEA
ncbi:MAG: hypothetical protein ACI9C0_001272, partial [Alteromonadaceae bacterium]